MTAPSRVLMTADAVGGVWTYALDLGAALTEAGCEVVLAVLGPSPSPAQNRAAARIQGLGVAQLGLELDWLAQSPDAVLEAGRVVAALAHSAGADLVHLNSPALATCGAFDRPVVGVAHSCLASWWAAVKDGPMPADFRWRTDLLAAGYRACAAVLAPSRAFAETTARLYPGVRPVPVHNGRARPAASPPSERPAAVITAGRLWDEGKNLAALDAAAAWVSAPVYAAGPLQGPNGQAVALAHAELLGALDAVSLAERFATIPVFASLAVYEPFGLTVLEAAQAGCALVLSDIPTFRELWDGAALFVPRCPASAAGALNRLLGDPRETRRRAGAARERAGRYTVRAMAEGTLAAYAAAMASRREAAA